MNKTYRPSIFSVCYKLRTEKWEYENIQIKSILLAKMGVFNIIFFEKKNEHGDILLNSALIFVQYM